MEPACVRKNVGSCACSCEAPDFICRNCGEPSATDGALSERSAASTVEARVAAIERRIDALSVTLHALGPGTIAQTAVVAAAAEPEDGARLNTGAAMPAVERGARSSVASCATTLPDVRSVAQAAIWDALGSGCRVVRIDGACGAGATTILNRLAANAADHSYSNGILLLSDVRGPAHDTAQRLEVMLSPVPAAQYAGATEFGTLGPPLLVLFDDADLTANEMATLCVLFADAQFVVVQQLDLPDAVTIELGPLHPQDALLVMTSAYGREIDSDNRRIALDLCLSSGLLPGPARLLATAARELQRSFISLRVQYVTGPAIVGAFIAQQGPLDKRLLAALSVAQAPLSAAELGLLIVDPALDLALERLVGLSLVGRNADDGYTLPGYVAHDAGVTADAWAERRQLAQSAPPPAPKLPARRRPARSRFGRKALAPAALVLLGLAFAVSAIVAFLAAQPPRAAFAITRFSTDARVIARGSKANLCVASTDAAVVDIFPGAIRSSGAGRHCTAVQPRATTTYIAVASNADGRQLREALTVSVFEPIVARRLFIAAFSARPARIATGESTQLCYRVTGARHLRLAPHSGNLTRLQTCETLRLFVPQRYTYRLSALGDNGQTAMRQVTVIVAARRTLPQPSPLRRKRPVAEAVAVYQFDATPAVVRYGESTSLCAGVERFAHGYVTHLGPLQSGVTRCYRVVPHATTTYRLYVRTPHSTVVRTMTVYIRPPGDVAR